MIFLDICIWIELSRKRPHIPVRLSHRKSDILIVPYRQDYGETPFGLL